MTLTAALKAQLFQIPNLPAIIEEVTELLEEERAKRNAFYEWVEPDVKVEFINGEIIENSPVTNEHSDAVCYIQTATHIHATINNLGKVKSEKAMISLTRNDYEPDVVFWRKEVADTFTIGQLHFPKPDLIIEVLSPGTETKDRGVKMKDYALHSIPEYWIVDTAKQLVEQYHLSEALPNEYELYKKLYREDDIQSLVLQGFKIPVAAIFDAKANMEAVAKMMGQ
jgi:Uma2 family endonuclease